MPPWCSKTAPRWLKMAQDGPSWPQDSPKMASRWPQMIQDGSKMAPRWKTQAREYQNLHSSCNNQRSATGPLQPWTVSRWLQDGHPAVCQRLAPELLGRVRSIAQAMRLEMPIAKTRQLQQDLSQRPTPKISEPAECAERLNSAAP